MLCISISKSLKFDIGEHWCVRERGEEGKREGHIDDGIVSLFNCG